jgi:HEAT repeat protein
MWKEWLSSGFAVFRKSEEEAVARSLAGALAMLESPDEVKRSAATSTLGRVGGDEALAALVRALEDPSVRVRGSAALALGRLGVGDSVAHLLRHLREDESGHVRAMCATSVQWLDDPRIGEAMLAALSDTEWKVVTAACAALQGLRVESAIPAILPLLDSENPHTQEAALRALVNLGARDPRIIPMLRSLAEDPATLEAERFGDALGELLSEHLGEPEPDVQRIRDLLRMAEAHAAEG